ncbi:nucleotidyltransferase domain-containing protein, partial [Deinococcus fonticola]|uniref:nucleotidyltransferase domain-containing protein n=1 Tax=Deinococcus fonticola TaxID=2528713 RepID=UPI00107552F8
MSEDGRRELEQARDEFLQRLTEKVQPDPRFLAMWLEGSLGRGKANRYSDVDVHVLLKEKSDGSAPENPSSGFERLSHFQKLNPGVAVPQDRMRADGVVPGAEL